jgi:hypothetical protein
MKRSTLPPSDVILALVQQLRADVRTDAADALDAFEWVRREVWENPDAWMKWCDARVLERNEDLVVALNRARTLVQPVTDEPNQDWVVVDVGKDGTYQPPPICACGFMTNGPYPSGTCGKCGLPYPSKQAVAYESR